MTTTRNEKPPATRTGPDPAATPTTDIVDQWGEQSFPASDPPANW